MRSEFDRRVLPDGVLTLVRAFPKRAPAHLAGGAALSGAFLSHRLSADIDLFCHHADDVRSLVRELPEIAREAAAEVQLVRDGGTFVRASARLTDATLEIDLVHDSTSVVAPPVTLEGLTLESFADLRANKVTCILSRSEPRDLVDLMFLERAGFPVEDDLERALAKDAGIDPGILAWLLGQFPLRPLPRMLTPLSALELEQFRNDLRERLKRLATPAR